MSTAFEPSATLVDETLTVVLTDRKEHTRQSLIAVVDRSYLGDLAAVEILDLQAQAPGAHLPVELVLDPFTWSYDDEVDAALLRLAPQRRQEQIDVDGWVSLSVGRVIIRLTFVIPGVSYLNGRGGWVDR